MRSKIIAFGIALIMFAVVLNGIAENSSSAPAGWSQPKRLNEESTLPAIAVNGNNIHVAYWKREGDLYYQRSIDNGKTWNQPKKIAEGIGYLYPKIAVSGNNVHIIYSSANISGGDYDLYYIKSINNGNTWQKEKLLKTRISDTKDIAVFNNNIHVVWIDWGSITNSDVVYYMRSTDNGNTWSRSTERILSNSGEIYRVSIGVNQNNIHVVYMMSPGTPYSLFSTAELFYTRSTNNGNTWTRSVRIAGWNIDARLFSIGNGSLGTGVLMEVNGNTIHVVWKDGYKRSTNNGLTWSPTKKIRAGDWMGFSLSQNNLHIVYAEGSPPNTKIFYTKSVNNGNTWSSPIELSKGNYPDIAVHNNNVHVVFSNVFYMRSPPF